MYRVLIVDDEEPVLDSYTYLLNNFGDDFTAAGRARSGYEALKMIAELQPDVVFMDINIPGLDGLEVIESLHDKFPGTVFILSTAYERFDIAQRAIPLGIFAYLVKPVSKKTFLNTLESVRSMLEKRQPPAPLVTIDLAERQFLKETIWRPISEENWKRYRELFAFRSDRAIVCLVETEDDQIRWCPEIADKLSFRYRCLFTLHANRGLYLISEDVDRDALSAYVEELVNATIPESLFSAFAVGQVHRGTELCLSCAEALDELRHKRSSADVQVRERLRVIRLRRRIGLSSLEEIRGLFTALWEEVFSAYSFEMAKAKMVALFTLLIDDSTGCYAGRTELSPPFMPAEEIMPLRDLPAWEEWSGQAIDKMHTLFTFKRAGNFPGPLAKAVDFINEHYVDPLQLSDTAEAAQISSAYLSRLFAEHLHTSFVDYLTELRVTRAAELIRETRLSIKEIAFAVGYQDPNYFSKIFRKATGLPPTIYAAERRFTKDETAEKEVL